MEVLESQFCVIMNLGWDPSDRFKEVGERACTPLFYSNPPPLNTNRNFIRAQFVGWRPRKLSRSRAAQAALTARWWIFPRQSHTLQVYTEYRITHIEGIRRVQSHTHWRYTQSTELHTEYKATHCSSTIELLYMKLQSLVRSCATFYIYTLGVYTKITLLTFPT